ncbi:MAG: aminotransferase class V-fold PLP-dependent enzyme [Oligoflexia bacterium]|nr:aminotransferase class V-fold PLP-dependent enzyme [Oligoflexia bacterium]
MRTRFISTTSNFFFALAIVLSFSAPVLVNAKPHGVDDLDCDISPATLLALQQAAVTELSTLSDNLGCVQKDAIGYPVNQDTNLEGFYRWYIDSGMYRYAINNVGNPLKPAPFALNTLTQEKQVVAYFSKLYGFDPDSSFGFVTSGGTDGNLHGVYYGLKYLQSLDPKEKPIVYVSDEAHYSVKKLADVTGSELRLIKSLPNGQMDLEDFKQQLSSTNPALIVSAIGTTFKGAIDDQEKIHEIVAAAKVPGAYYHLDAALFGGFLPFLKDEKARTIVDHSKMKFDSISVSGHKFFGLDEPAGLFVTTSEVMNHLNPESIPYLNGAVPTISCSRNGLTALKLWWKIKTTPKVAFQKQAEEIVANAKYLQGELQKMGIKSWMNPQSNTVFFERPASSIMKNYNLAADESNLYGPLAHIVVMQHVTRPVLDNFLARLATTITSSKK